MATSLFVNVFLTRIVLIVFSREKEMAAKLEAELCEFASKGNVKGMLDFAEAKEMELLDDKAFSSLFFCMICVGNLIQGDVVSARFALRRCASLPPSKELTKCSELTRALWNNQDAAAIAILQSFDIHGLGKLLQQAVIARAIAGFASSYTAATTAMVAKHLAVQEAVVRGIVPVVDGVKLGSDGVLSSTGDIRGNPLSKEAVQLLTDSAVLLRQPYEW